MAPAATPLLEVRDLCIEFVNERGFGVRAVDGVSFAVEAGETVALVGESGSGKSVTALALTRLLEAPPARYTGGAIRWQGRDVFSMSAAELRALRGGQIAYIFQEPSTSLNPVLTIGAQIGEAVRLHRPDVRDVHAVTVKALEDVGIVDAAARVRAYPHELSGGMQQRAMIAMALASGPQLLVADEPTTALDVTIQKQILDLLCDLKQRTGMAILMITHNFGLVSNFADKIVVMFRGRVVEAGLAADVLRAPQHPYTRALLECVPRLGQAKGRLHEIDYAALEAAMRT